MDIKGTLKERGKTHGNFLLNATLSQELKRIIKLQTTVVTTKDQQEALEVICAKIARICTGDPNHADSWHDIAGYAVLIEERLLKDQQHE